jgi:hypothetical protein
MNDKNISHIVKSYQQAVKTNNTGLQKRCFTDIYGFCKKMLWYIAWTVWKKCRLTKKKYECIGRDHKQRWTWKEFNYPLIHGLHIAAERFDAHRYTKFSSFAFQCVHRTLLNFCERMCPFKVQHNDEELQEHISRKTPTTLDRLIRDQEVAVIIKAIRKSFTMDSVELQILVLYMIGFIQKDIVFFLNSTSCSNITEPGVCNYLKQYIPRDLVESAAELRDYFSQLELERFNIKKLRDNEGFLNQFIRTYSSVIEQIKQKLLEILGTVPHMVYNSPLQSLDAFTDEFQDAVSCVHNHFHELLYNQKKLKNIMKVIKHVYIYQKSAENQRVL